MPCSPVVIALAFALAEPAHAGPEPGPVRVAAAADLQAAFVEVGKAFERSSGTEVSFTFGSTGLLAKQLKEGAPFDVFAAANQSFVDDVVKTGACDGATQALYARGRIVVWTKKGAIKAPTSLADVADPRFLHVALANPEHAPYGSAAREALTSVGVWDQLGPRVVLGENVRQALQLAETGNADAAIVALSLAIPSRGGTWFLVDEKLHQPLEQSLVVCKGGTARRGGEAFARYLTSAPARAILATFGFEVRQSPEHPGSTLASETTTSATP